MTSKDMVLNALKREQETDYKKNSDLTPDPALTPNSAVTLNPTQIQHQTQTHNPVPWIEIETRDELISAALGKEKIGWPERVEYTCRVGMDAVGFVHWERFGCDVIKKGNVLGFNARITSREDMDKFTMPQKIDYQSLRDNVRRAKDAIGESGLALFVAHVLCLDPIIMDMGMVT